MALGFYGPYTVGALSREPSLTDVTDAEWHLLAPHLPASTAGGRPRHHSVRDILKALCDLLRSGCAWRLLPHDLPPWKTVSHDFRLWRLQGVWNAVHQARHTAVRVQVGRDPQPRAAILASQAVKTTRVGGPRGSDGGKNVKGRQRPRLVETPGLLMRAVVPPADMADRDGATLLLAPLQGQGPRLQPLGADSADRGKASEWIQTPLGWTVAIVTPWWTALRYVWVGPGQERPTMPSGFHGLPRRWVVERTCAWLMTYRRLRKDDEELPETSEALIDLAMSRLMVRRLVQ